MSAPMAVWECSCDIQICLPCTRNCVMLMPMQFCVVSQVCELPVLCSRQCQPFTFSQHVNLA